MCIFAPKHHDHEYARHHHHVAQFIEWTFNTVLLPINNSFNWAVIGLGLVGLLFWLRLQKKYNVRAEDSTIMWSDQSNSEAFP